MAFKSWQPPAGRLGGRRIERLRGPVHVRRLEQPQVRPAMCGVVTGGIEEPRKEPRPHDAVLVAERVVESQERDVVEPEPLDRGRRSEAVRDALAEAAVAQKVLEPAAKTLAAREAADRTPAGGQRRGQLLEAVDARNLLDEIGLAPDVAVARGGHAPALGRVGLRRRTGLRSSRA